MDNYIWFPEFTPLNFSNFHQIVWNQSSNCNSYQFWNFKFVSFLHAVFPQWTKIWLHRWTLLPRPAKIISFDCDFLLQGRDKSQALIAWRTKFVEFQKTQCISLWNGTLSWLIRNERLTILRISESAIRNTINLRYKLSKF